MNPDRSVSGVATVPSPAVVLDRAASLRARRQSVVVVATRLDFVAPPRRRAAILPASLRGLPGSSRHRVAIAHRPEVRHPFVMIPRPAASIDRADIDIRIGGYLESE